MARIALLILLLVSAIVPMLPASHTSAAPPCHGDTAANQAHETHRDRPQQGQPDRPAGHDCIGCVASPLQLSARPISADRLLVVTGCRAPADPGHALLTAPPEPPPPRNPA